MTTDNLDKLTEEAYDAWEIADPPEGFADRVLAELAAVEAPPPPIAAGAGVGAGAPRSGWPFRLRGLLVGAAIATIAAAGATLAARWIGGAETRDPAIHLSPEGGGSANIGITPSARPESADDEVRPLAPELGLKIDEHISGYGRRYGEVFAFHGTIVVAQGDEVLVRRSYGEAVRRGDAGGPIPHRADQRFRLGTLSQQITASAVLLLVERGLLGLDDPIRKHLPGYPEVGDRITIRHLLSHTSGIPSFTDDPLFDGWRGQPHTTSELLDRFKELPLEFQPGADFDPSNSGYAVLGAVIEAVSGVSHGEYIRREIFEPLGMTRSSVGEPSGGAMVIPGYLFDEDEALNAAKSARVDLTAFGAAGDVVTTADDLTRWASALFGGELLRPETVELMLTPVTEDGYALGWILGDANGQRIAEHPGGSEGVNAAIRYYRSDHALVVAVANNDVIDCREMVEKVGDLAHGRPAAWPLEYEEVTPDAARFPLYVGEYALSDESRESLARYFEAEEIDRLATAQVLVDGGRLFFWVPGHGTKWMHARDGDSFFFFKDASRTTATFQLELRADEHVVNPGAFRQGGERPGGAVDLGPASALILHQGALDIVLERRAGSDAEPLVLPSP